MSQMYPVRLSGLSGLIHKVAVFLEHRIHKRNQRSFIATTSIQSSPFP
uniref:Uncharacterized protein n=1 Tax=Anguilla anguilla TaxID=7936 RepID=A0A0E9VJ52_ANGAN